MSARAGSFRGLAERCRVILWAFRARLAARRAVLDAGFRGLDLLPAPRTTSDRTRDVQRVLNLTSSKCLVVSAVLQEWYVAQGLAYDLVIGVRPPGKGFAAHAWLDMPGEVVEGFTEIARVPARSINP